MNGALKKIITAVVSLFLLAYVGYQAYLALYLPFSTEKASLQTVEDDIPANVFVVSEEKVISAGYNGILDYKVQDGETIAKNGVVAEVYPNAQQAENEREVLALTNKIRQLEVNNVNAGTAAVDIDMLNSELKNKFSELAGEAKGPDVSGIGSTEAEFLNLLNQKEIATGTTVNFNAKLAQLQAKKASLQLTLSGNVQKIISPVSGYFVSKTDGLENRFSFADVASITTAQVNSLLAAKPPESAGSAIGKVISSYQWYPVCVLSAGNAGRLSIGSKVSLAIPYSQEGDVSATVTAINRDSGGNCAVVFQCGVMSDSLSLFRSGKIQIVLGKYSGIKVDDQNIYMNSGVKGVYILEGNTAEFKKLDVVYSGDGYVVSQITTSDSDELQLYDEIIVGGKNLYDGKVVK